MNLNTARIFVRNLDQAKSFYSESLGLTAIAISAEYGYCVFKTGGAQLIVESVSNDAPPEEQELVGRFTGLSFTVADVQHTYHSLAAAGVEFTGPPEKQAWGGILATLRDPAGNELQVVQPAVT